MFSQKYLALASVVLFAGSACKKSDDDTAESSTSTEIASADLATLNLSDALSIKLPETFEGSGTALSLEGSGRSQEACRMHSTVKEGFDAIGEVASMFCHFEVEEDTILPGNKYNVTFTGGLGVEEGDAASSYQIWIDDSKLSENEVTVNFCEDSQLTQLVVITGVNAEKKSKGSMIVGGDSEFEDGVTHSWKRSVTFDNGFTDESRTVITSKDKFSSSGTETSSFARLLAVDLVEDAVSKVSVSENGTWNGSEFANAGASKFDATHGMAKYVGSGSDTGGAYDFSTQSFFDGAWNILTQGSSAKFKTGGTLSVEDSEVPGLLPANYNPRGFPKGAWDCGASNKAELIEVEINPENEGHNACEVNRSDEQNQCWSEDFATGEPKEIDENERPDAEKFEVEVEE